LEKNSGVEVVILDIKMPNMDGMTALKEIKSKFPLVEVIMLTGHATVETGIEGMKMGAFDYLMKPCDMDQLIEKVNEAAKRKRDQEEKIWKLECRRSLCGGLKGNANWGVGCRPFENARTIPINTAYR
jgi:DNA-binding NtrC family response regulator